MTSCSTATGGAVDDRGGRGVLRTALRCQRRALAMLAAGALLLLGSTAAASAQVGPTSGEIEEFDYTLTNVNPPLASPGLLFATRVSASAGGSVLVQSGSLENAEFLANSWGIVPSGTDTVNAQVTDWRIVTAST